MSSNEEKKKHLLYVNLGTPNSPEPSDVKAYLKEFLMDPRVLDIPKLWRTILVHGIIVPFRAKKSSHAYKLIWQKEGSPLRINSEKFVAKLRDKISDKYKIGFAMRYGEPNLQSVLRELLNHHLEADLCVLSAYPQYALSSSESTFEEVRRLLTQMKYAGHVEFIQSYAANDGFVSAYAKNIEQSIKEFAPDYLLFSYHGLPIRHVKKISPNCQGQGGCSTKDHDWNKLCYRRQCFITTEKILKKLKLENLSHSTSFQSRLSEGWIQPFSDHLYRELPKKE